MVFSSTSFILYFLPATLIAYKLSSFSKKIQIQNVVLLLCSLLFYSWGGFQYLGLLLILIGINYIIGLAMSKTKHAKSKKMLMCFGIAIDVAVLLAFKYLNFISLNLNKILQYIANGRLEIKNPNIVLPIGISFFTFQIMSYLIDLYRGEVQVQRNIIKFALYIMMFPQLIAGPIVRYADIEKEINDRRTSLELEEQGLKRFILGFGKKILLANAVGSFADFAFSYTNEMNFLWAWLGAICYALQIYFDFSAYSDMAIGLGWIFGFHFNENFNYPYISLSIKEFWRRWHISLSTWFRDYVYIPLGGNRKGVMKTYRNLLIVFFITGFWHGAAWQFIFWGLYHGLFLILERLGLGKLLCKLPKMLQRIYTLVVVVVGWVFFRADSISAACAYLKQMFCLRLSNLVNDDFLAQLSGMFVTFFALSCVISTPIFSIMKRRSSKKLCVLYNALYICLLIVSIAFMMGASYNPFIYFKF